MVVRGGQGVEYAIADLLVLVLAIRLDDWVAFARNVRMCYSIERLTKAYLGLSMGVADVDKIED
jgi:hypothetical protein